MTAAIAAAAFAFSGSSPAQAASLVGTWRGTIVLNGTAYTSTLELGAGGSYRAMDRAGGIMLGQTGTWIANGPILRIVASTQTRCAPGCTATEVPPPGSYRVQWIAPNVIRLYDLRYGGPPTTYRRY